MIVAGLGLSATVHPCRKRRWGQAELACREVHRRRAKVGHQRVCRGRRTQSLDGDPWRSLSVIRKDSLCKGHHRRIGERRIRIGTRLRARVDRVAIRANHDDVRFFEVIDELV